MLYVLKQRLLVILVVLDLSINILMKLNKYIGMKGFGADSIILGTRKLCRMFPIKQKCHTTTAFLDNPKFSIWSSLVFVFTSVQQACRANKLHNELSNNLASFKHFCYKKSCRGINFLLIWKHSPYFSGTYVLQWLKWPKILSFLFTI